MAALAAVFTPQSFLRQAPLLNVNEEGTEAVVVTWVSSATAPVPPQPVGVKLLRNCCYARLRKLRFYVSAILSILTCQAASVIGD
jgi:hypothetical protein